MEKRGLELSFSMIFSIIIIISIIAVSFYAIGKFLEVKDCGEQASFYEEFQQRINRAWSSEIVKDTYVGRISGGVDKICLGELSQATNSEEYEELKSYRASGGNVFLYPPSKACEGFVTQQIEHLGFAHQGIKCFDVENGKVSIPISKTSTDALVMVSGD